MKTKETIMKITDVEFSVLSLIKAIEENLFAFHPYFMNWSRSEGQTGPRLMWSITDLPFPIFNNILGARLKPDEADIEIEAAISRGRKRNVPFLWFIGPSTTPADLGKHLIAHGFILDEDAHGMAADLNTLKEVPAKQPDLTITQVKSYEALHIWCNTLISGYRMPEFSGPAFLEWFGSFTLAPRAPLRHYIGWWNGKPAAAGSMLLAAGTAGIYNVTTLNEFRGHGIGSAITQFPLREARTEGYRTGVLQSTPQGFSIYSKLRFKEYCSISSYVWKP
jgi:predicted GNAT family acetyltransferase